MSISTGLDSTTAVTVLKSEHAVLARVAMTQTRMGRETCLFPSVSLATAARHAQPSLRLLEASNWRPAHWRPSATIGPICIDGRQIRQNRKEPLSSCSSGVCGSGRRRPLGFCCRSPSFHKRNMGQAARRRGVRRRASHARLRAEVRALNRRNGHHADELRVYVCLWLGRGHQVGIDVIAKTVGRIAGIHHQRPRSIAQNEQLDLALIHAPDGNEVSTAGQRRVAVVLRSNSHIEELGNQVPITHSVRAHRIEGPAASSRLPEDFHSRMFGGSRSIVGGVLSRESS